MKHTLTESDQTFAVDLSSRLRLSVEPALSKDEDELVVRDYFKDEKRTTQSGPDSVPLSGDIVNALAGHSQYAIADSSASAAKVIGHVTKLLGTATVVRNGVPILLNEGDNVNKGDLVQAGSNSSLDLAFIDGTVFALASNARMVLNEMMYAPNGSNESLSDVPDATKPEDLQPKSISHFGSTPASPVTPPSHADDILPHADAVPLPAVTLTPVSIAVVPPNGSPGTPAVQVKQPLLGSTRRLRPRTCTVRR